MKTAENNAFREEIIREEKGKNKYFVSKDTEVLNLVSSSVKRRSRALCAKTSS